MHKHNLYKLLFSAVAGLMGTVLMSGPVTALSYQTEVQPQFTFKPTISISLASSDLTINDLAPNTNKTSNTENITVKTNNASGYYLTAAVGNSTYDSTSLINSVDSNKVFTSLANDASIASPDSFNPGEWGYSSKANSAASWSNYSGLNKYGSPKTIAETTAPSVSGGDIYNFHIAAKASSTQASGTYNNVITFYAVAK
jgi:hypothetical protein